MDLAFRGVSEADLPQCMSLLAGRLAYDGDTLARLPGAWRRLLRDGALVAGIVEDRTPPVDARILGFGASVFVTGAFMRQARAGTEPYLTARVIRAELEGVTPVLRPTAIRKANAGDGLNVVILHYGEAADLDEEALRQVRYLTLESFLWAHRGYCVKEVLQEFWDEIDPRFVSQGWGRVRTDYAGFYASQGAPIPPPGRGPCLVGLGREEVAAEPGTTIMSPLFLYTPPRFGFRPGEQQLLELAIGGRTDAQLARALHVAEATVKGRWRSIYDRVAASAPDLAPATITSAEIRGKEKRRKLLDYIRRHPEELRPLAHRGRRSIGP